MMLTNRSAKSGAVAVVLLCAIVFWRTAYPTITWWDSSQYSLAAATLGISGPPGSLFLTLLGWVLTRIPLGVAPAYALNLLAAVLASVTIVLVYVVALRVLGFVNRSTEVPSPAVAFGAALGALTLAYSTTLWEYAVMFTPYILTTVFTGLILWTMVRWWEEADRPDAWRHVAVLGLLFGLDFSVHRTNSMLMPAALVWMLIRNRRALSQPRTWLAGGGGLIAGLAVHLVLIPIAATSHSQVNWVNPSNLSRFWDFVSLKKNGGGFLVQFLPRKTAFWSGQVGDLLRTVRDCFFQWKGTLGVLGMLPAVAAAFGLLTLWRRDRRFATAFALVVVLHASMTVLYFNIPGDFFRTFDRHYLPICVVIAVLVACGLGEAMARVAELTRAGSWVVPVLVVPLVLLAPLAQLAGNWKTRDASQRFFARDFAVNMLTGLPPNAILFTVGDNDTFPLMYMQSAEGVRPDVTILNTSVISDADYVDAERRIHPALPLTMTREERTAALAPRIRDSTIVVAVAGSPDQLGVPPGTALPAAITVHVKPTYGTSLWLSDVVVLELFRANAWRRPMTFAVTSGSSPFAGLRPYARLDGLFFRIVPFENPAIDTQVLRANLVRNQYRGFADSAMVIGETDRTMAFQYHAAVAKLLEAQQQHGETVQCAEAESRMWAAVPPDRLRLGEMFHRRCS